MQQDLANVVHSYLPEINASEINFVEEANSQPYVDSLSQFTEKIHGWANTVLENAKLPTNAHEARALTTKYLMDSNEGCALHMVIELDSIKKSLAQNDATTAALASMKLADAVWHSSIFRNINEKQEIVEQKAKPTPAPAPRTKPNTSAPAQTVKSNASPVINDQDAEKIALYQSTMNDLKGKYPNCNVNALRLLAATRLNTSKQELDELDISPE